MTTKNSTLEVPEKEELAAVDRTERTRETPVYVPRADIYEKDENVILIVDMPGVDDKNIDINLEKNVLTISGYVDPSSPEGFSPAYMEYGLGDYQRSFSLSNEIDRERIEAVVKNGVLRLTLPKLAAARNRKIEVKSA